MYVHIYIINCLYCMNIHTVFKPKPGERSEFTVQIKASGKKVDHARAGK